MRKVGKEEVYDFIKKVERKAVNSVNDKYRANMEVAIKDFMLLYPEFKEAMDEIINTSNHLNNCVKAFRSTVAPQYGVEIGRWEMTSEVNFGFTPLVEFFRNRSVKDPVISELKSKWVAETDSVRAVYKEVMIECKKKRDGNQAVKYLESLGFDVSYFEEEQVTIDPTKLFPCKENGL